MTVLLSLDLSTTETGYAKFDIASKTLLSYGSLKSPFRNPIVKGKATYEYPVLQTLKIRGLVALILGLIDVDVTFICIEEINRGKSRLGQKVLDSLHAVLLETMRLKHLQMVTFFDSDGKEGWRSVRGLKLQLSDFDKVTNKANKKLNKKLGKKEKKLPVITQKTLACRYVNKRYNLNLDPDTQSDAGDAIGLGTFVLDKVLNA